MTIKANQAVLNKRPFSNVSDFEDAKRGLIAQDKSLITTDKEGNAIWDMPSYDFVDFKGNDGSAPGSVNPSLWRQASLNNIHGLFKVSEGIYQLRGYDLANMTIIEGDSGWILVDPLTAKETANKALKFAQQQPELWHLLFEHRAANPDHKPEHLLTNIDSLFDLVKQELLGLKPLATDTDVTVAAHSLWCGVHGIAVLMLKNKLFNNSQHSAQQALDCLLNNFIQGWINQGENHA